MTCFLTIVLAVLSIWDYPARQTRHAELKDAFVLAMQSGNTAEMEKLCREGVELLPDDPTWAYNLACALAYHKDQTESLDWLEKAIDLGFRDVEAIANDNDLKRLEKNQRFKELVEYAKEMSTKPVLFGPLASVPATSITGKTVAIGEQNLTWDFELGLFSAKLALAQEGAGGNSGDLYMNRDGDHSRICVTNFSGLTEVRLDSGGREHGMDVDYPNMLFPYPVFGNCSRAFVEPTYWRSLPRAMMTMNVDLLPRMTKLYLSNQIWVYPANADFPPIGTHGDVFLSVAPYWIVTQGRSYSDQYYLEAALEISRSLHPTVKRAVVAQGLLAPLVQKLIRRSLVTVECDDDYLSYKAHPTCMPPEGLDLERLKSLASSLKINEIPPVAIVRVLTPAVANSFNAPECIYASACSTAFILRAPDNERVFTLSASGGAEYAFKVVHGVEDAAVIEKIDDSTAKVTLDCSKLVGRLDVAIFAKSAKSDWGAPSFVSFSVPNPEGSYSDPMLVPKISVE